MKRTRNVQGIPASRWSAGIVPLIFCCILLLLTSRIALAQADGAPSPADDAPDPDALARVQSSDAPATLTGGFVKRVGDHFEQNGHYYLVKGVNFKLRDHGWDMWQHYNDPGVKSEVDTELQKARDLRANVIRIFVTTDNFGGIPAMWGRLSKPFFDTALPDLDDFLTRADAKGLKVLITLYDGVNGVEQVPAAADSPGAMGADPTTPDATQARPCRGMLGNPNSGAYAWENTSPDGNSNTWYHGPDIRPFRNHADGLLTHVIPGTNRTFASDARIFGWDVMNEPDHLYHLRDGCTNVVYTQAYVNRWIAWMARHMRLYDTNHPIGAGTYGWFLNTADRDRHSINCDTSSIQEVWTDTDFASVHWYQLNTPPDSDLDGGLACAQRSGRPVVLEEIGQADGGYQDNCQPQPWNETWVNNWTAQWTAIANNRGISGALAWTNYNFNQNSGNPHGYTPCGQPSNSNFFGLYRFDGSLKPAGATFRQNALSPTCSRASFRTYDGTHYLMAQTSGARWLSAAGTSSSHTPFTIIPGQGGGYYFGLRSPELFYVSADGGGGGGVHVDKSSLSWWESFGIIPLQRFNANQWLVALHASNNQFVAAENGGGDAVNANRNAAITWETFVMTCE